MSISDIENAFDRIIFFWNKQRNLKKLKLLYYFLCFCSNGHYEMFFPYLESG